ncbi:tail fiber domain-containing protein [Pantoea dispersa]|uniref:tail fiber domain-containing protein n=1 Tax=Pantoea dispersa TaxID=59814 RepID=UPI0021C96265|nr:tail fiber domain-containing protein [Pantoea dispersa]UXO69999.1 tail fiber domain-containing protein [Pantoea dispersa]
MSAGTIALTNNSATVTGTGTSFTTELKPGDFVYVTVGGAPDTLVASSITSDSQLTLAVAYDGPTTTGLAWNAVPASLQVAITQKILNDFAQVARGRILDFQNWQKIYSSDQSVTVTRPDRTTFTGPSWGYMAAQYVSKANTADVLTKADNLASVTNKATARANLGLDYGTTAGTVAQGNDSRFSTVNGMTGGTISSAIRVNGALTVGVGFIVKDTTSWAPEPSSGNGNNVTYRTYGPTTNDYGTSDLYVNSGNYWAIRHIMVNSGGVSRVWEMRSDNSFRSPGTVYAAGTALTSDARLKSNFEDVHYDLDIIDEIIPQYYDKRIPDGDEVPTVGAETSGAEGSESEIDIPPPPEYVRELGIVAQKLQKVLPGLVSSYYWNEKYPDLLSINYSGLAAWLVGYVANLKDLVKSQGETITKQDGIISKMEVRLAELESRMKAIDGLDA